MPFKLVVLWTDALVFLLVAAIVALVWHVRRHEHLAAPWRKVARDASGMAAGTVLSGRARAREREVVDLAPEDQK